MPNWIHDYLFIQSFYENHCFLFVYLLTKQQPPSEFDLAKASPTFLSSTTPQKYIFPVYISSKYNTTLQNSQNIATFFPHLLLK